MFLNSLSGRQNTMTERAEKLQCPEVHYIQGPGRKLEALLAKLPYPDTKELQSVGTRKDYLATGKLNGATQH